MRKRKPFKAEIAQTACESALFIIGMFALFGVTYGVITVVSDVTDATLPGVIAIAVISAWAVSTICTLAFKWWEHRE